MENLPKLRKATATHRTSYLNQSNCDHSHRNSQPHNHRDNFGHNHQCNRN